MKILDTNMILRYLLNDHAEMAAQTEQILMNEKVLIMPEVIAEVVYVLKSVYQKERTELAQGVLLFMELENLTTTCKNSISVALQLYSETKLDFVDCLLCAYHMEYGYEICTFDKKLNRLIQQKDAQTKP